MSSHPHARRAALLSAVLATLVLNGCSTPTAGPPQVRLVHEKYVLANGLEVILRRDPRLPLVGVNVWYHVGPAKEGPGRTGFAHLFEHMMFQGSAHVPPDQHFQMLEGAGASMVNGSTSLDRTNYMEDLPADQLELALWLEADRMGFLLDRLDQGMLSNQQDVVRNERRQGVENAPYGLADEAVYQTLFPAGHPYHAAVIGSHADIQAARLEDVRGFFTDYYAPNNATLAVVGDIDIAATKALIEKYFGTLPKGPEVAPVEVETAPLEGVRRVAMTDQVELPRIYMGWITAPYFSPGDAEADLAARILGGGKASRLHKSLVYEQRIAQDVSAYQQSATLGSIFQIAVTAKPGHTVEELEAAIDAVIDSLAAQGPTAGELAAARNAIQTGIVASLENVGGVADRLQTYNHYVDTPDYIARDLGRYSEATPAAVQKFVREQLPLGRRAIIEVRPGPKVLPPSPPTPPAPKVAEARIASREPWRAEAPKPAPAGAATLPSARTFTLPNGLAVYLVEDHALPLVAAELVVRAGSAADAAGKFGLAKFTAEMLDEGAAGRDAPTLAQQLEALGSGLGIDVGRDGTTLGLRALKPNAAAALGILADVAQRPDFPAAEVERVRNDHLTSLLQDRDQPFRIAATVMWADLYGAGNPYGHMAIGNEPGLKAITREDLVGFHQRAYGPKNSALVLAGDLTEAEARRLAAAAFGTWSGGAQAPPDARRTATTAEKVLVVDKPGSPSTTLSVAQIAVERSHPDYERLMVMNQVLGGLFSSRINMNLRERNGFTYGAFSGLPENTAPGPLSIGTDVRADATGPAIREILKEVDGMRANPVSAAELSLAKQSIARSLPAYFQNTTSTAGTVGNLFLLGLAPDYYQGLPARVDAMTAEEVHAATLAHLDPARLKVIAVGDRRTIDPQVAALGIGPLGYRRPDGRPEPSATARRLPLP